MPKPHDGPCKWGKWVEINRKQARQKWQDTVTIQRMCLRGCGKGETETNDVPE